MFRLARIVRVARFARAARLAKFLGAMNRGMRALRRTMRRHAFGYVVVLTLLVLFTGAAAMMAFERASPGFETYAGCVWWTTMLLLSIGTEFWPRTTEGRVLAILLALYSLGVFGYITAMLASYFIGEAAAERERKDYDRQRRD